MTDATPLDWAMMQGSWDREAIQARVALVQTQIDGLIEKVVSYGKDDTAMVCHALLEVMNVVNGWHRLNRAVLGCDEAALSILEAIEKGLR